MKKAYVVLFGFLFLNIGIITAQPEPPSGLTVRIRFEPSYPPHALLGWNENQPGVNHFLVFLDGVLVPNNMGGGPYWTQGVAYFIDQTVPGGITPDTYHQAGIIAVDNNGLSSDTANFTFYFCETAYSHPDSLEVINDLESGTSSFTWSEPSYGGGPGQPTVVDYHVYLDGNYVSTTTDEHFTFTGLNSGTNYVAGVTTNYSDGYSDSCFFPNYAKKEFYFDTLPAPVHPAVDESNGILTWEKPNSDNEVIGGTFTAYPWSGAGWECSWPNPDEKYITFGTEEHFVNSRWKLWSWVHDWPKYEDREGLWLEWFQIDPQPSFNYAIADVRTIAEINNAGGLNYDLNQSVLDATTNPSGIGGFVVHYNAEHGYYGVLRLDDVYDRQENPECTVLGKVDYTWWFQTNGSDDFSSAYNYFPKSYNIYLDGELVTTVVPDTLNNNSFEYHFENLVPGQQYTAGIEAVYHVGKSKMVTVDFTPSVGIQHQGGLVASALKASPNPFSDQTNITFSLPESTWASVEITDLRGVKVTTLMKGRSTAGEHRLIWERKNNAGELVTPGFYFCTLLSENTSSTIKLLVK